MADPRHASFRPDFLFRRSGKSDDVERKRDLADDALDLLGIRESRDEEAARAGIGKCLSALDDLIDQRIVIDLRLQEQIGARVDIEVGSDSAADRRDPRT